MSGGHWDYGGSRAREALDAVAQDATVRERWPLTASAFAVLAGWVPQADHDMDWDISGDTCIKDDGKFDVETFSGLFVGLMNAAPDAWFPRGKWATIQAIRERIEK